MVGRQHLVLTDDTLVIGASLFWWYHSQYALNRRSHFSHRHNSLLMQYTESKSGHHYESRFGVWTHSQMGDWNPWD